MRQARFSESGLVGLEQTRKELGLVEDDSVSFLEWLETQVKKLLWVL